MITGESGPCANTDDNDILYHRSSINSMKGVQAGMRIQDLGQVHPLVVRINNIQPTFLIPRVQKLSYFLLCVSSLCYLNKCTGVESVKSASRVHRKIEFNFTSKIIESLFNVFMKNLKV